MTVIPFYGAEDPVMFAIERRAMDRDGFVIAALDRALPPGANVDVVFRVGLFTRASRGTESSTARER